jgi:hypothetical protein
MINTYKYPNELVSNEEKDSFEFGKKYAEAIWSEWDHKLSMNKQKFKLNRAYAIGDHPIERCKKNIKRRYINDEFLHIDWDDKLNLLPKLLRKVYNSVDMKEFTPSVYALDPTAREEKSTRKNEKLDLFYAKDFIQQMAQVNGGFSDIPAEQIPESKEQVELEELTEQPLSIETAEELVLQSVSKENMFEEIQSKVLKDAVECGLGVAAVETCKVEGIKIRWVRPENFIHSKTNNKFFTDCTYFAEERLISIYQLKNIAKASGIVLLDEDIRKMVMATVNEDIDDNKTLVRVLYYNFETFHQTVLKKKIDRETKAIKLIDRTKDIGTDKEYNPDPNYKSDVSEKISSNHSVWYEGIMVLSNERKVIRHRLIENMPEYKGNILPPYIAFAPRITDTGYNPIVEEVIPRVDSIQELRMRITHQRNKLRGIISEIDPDMIANITLGNKKLTPDEVLSFYFSLDIAFRKTLDEDGEPTQGNRALTEIPTGIPYALRELMVQFVEDVRLLDESFGYLGFDQAKPDPKTLFDIEPYRLSDNIQMKDYSDSLHTWSILIFQVVSSRINDIFKWSNIKDKYIGMIGTDDVDILEKYKNRSSHYFGIYQDYVPTRQERMALIQNVNSYVTQQIIDPLDGEEILNIRNKKVALRTLRLKIDKRKKENQDFEMQKVQEANNGNIQASRISNEEKRITIQLEAELKAKQKREEFEMQMKLLEAEGLLKLQTENERSNFKARLEQMRMDFQSNETAFKKDRDEEIRIKGIDKSADNQQQLIKLRNGEIDNIREENNPEINLSNTI